jgi:putative membrane protein
MTMLWLDAGLAYLHFLSIFMLFAFLTTQALLIRRPLDASIIRLLGRVDIYYFAASGAVLATGFLRALFGAKGPDFYFHAWPIYAKLSMFLVVGIVSIKPTITFIAWRRALERDAAFRVPEAEQAWIRKLVMIEVHIAALIPIAAVIMSRGLGR